jgi:hypothetical protein
MTTAFLSVGGRRFLLITLSVVGIHVLCWLGKIGESVFRDCLLGLVVTYATANTIQKIRAPGNPDG